jgi:hypothetical protein
MKRYSYKGKEVDQNLGMYFWWISGAFSSTPLSGKDAAQLCKDGVFEEIPEEPELIDVPLEWGVNGVASLSRLSPVHQNWNATVVSIAKDFVNFWCDDWPSNTTGSMAPDIAAQWMREGKTVYARFKK